MRPFKAAFWHFLLASWKFITFRVSRRRREMYNGHGRLCVYVCVSVPHRMPTLLHAPGCDFLEW